MRLESLRIRRYRSIEDAELPACGAFNVLIGRNNSGKSTILSAIRAFFTCIEDGVASIDPPIRQQIDFFNRDTSVPIEILAQLSLSDADRRELIDGISAEAPQMRNAVDGLPTRLQLRVTLSIMPPPRRFAYVKKISLASSLGANPGEQLILLVSEATASELRERLTETRKKRQDAERLSRMLKNPESVDHVAHS